MNRERTNNKQIIFPKVPSFRKLTAAIAKERKGKKKGGWAENGRSAKSAGNSRLWGGEKQNERESRRLENLYFPTAFFIDLVLYLSKWKKKKKGKREKKKRGGRGGGSFRTRLYSASFNRFRVAGVSLPADDRTPDEHFVPCNS